MRKTVFGIVTITIFFIAGFVYLLRGCLSKYDERSALLPVLYFEKNDTPVIFSIVKYSKAISYSQEGGFVQKTVNTNYFIQHNDGNTGAELLNQKIKNHLDIKNFPVEVLGATSDKAWLYMGELMAFNPFTLEKIADTRILERINPFLTNKFPGERKYYIFNAADSAIYFTATDGSKWELNTSDLSINRDENSDVKRGQESVIKKIEQLQKKNQADQDSNYRRNITASELSSQGKINRNAYNKMVTDYYTVRERLYRERDSLGKLKSEMQAKDQATKDHLSALENMERINPGYYSIKTNADSVHSKWYGLFSDAELDKLYERFQYTSENDETALRKIFSSGFIKNNAGEFVIDKTDIAALSDETFLHGGFLLDKNTAAPVHYNNGWLIVSREQIGREGKIMVSFVDNAGHTNWTFNTQLHDWLDRVFAGNHLYVFGNDNNKLSGNDCNVLWCINLATGKARRFDYFTEK